MLQSFHRVRKSPSGLSGSTRREQLGFPIKDDPRSRALESRGRTGVSHSLADAICGENQQSASRRGSLRLEVILLFREIDRNWLSTSQFSCTSVVHSDSLQRAHTPKLGVRFFYRGRKLKLCDERFPVNFLNYLKRG